MDTASEIGITYRESEQHEDVAKNQEELVEVEEEEGNTKEWYKQTYSEEDYKKLIIARVFRQISSYAEKLTVSNMACDERGIYLCELETGETAKAVFIGGVDSFVVEVGIHLPKSYKRPCRAFAVFLEPEEKLTNKGFKNVMELKEELSTRVMECLFVKIAQVA